MRIKIIRLVIGVFLLVILGYLVYIQGIRGRYFNNLSVNNRIRVIPSDGWRGRILDRNGKILADNTLSLDVVITPQDLYNPDAVFIFLGKVLDVDPNKLMEEYIKRKISNFAPVIVAEDIPRQRAIAIEENKYRFPSLSVQQNFKRQYPLGENAVHVLGYVAKINRARMKKLKEYGYSPQSATGYGGAEEYYDFYLRGTQGGLQLEVNSRGEQVRLLSLKRPLKGEDIALTIDSDVQKIIHQALGGRKGAIVIMDMMSGEILGLSSSPGFDPGVFTDRKNSQRLSALFRNQDAPLLNRAVSGVYPPGSIFKIPVALAALESHKITRDTTFLCDGAYELGGIQFRCTHVHGPQDLIQAIAHSCNIYFYHLGLMLGADILHDYARQLGLGTLTHIDLPFERAGNIPSRRARLLSARKKWFTGETLNYSIGQGEILTTPLQLVRMLSIVGRDGVEVQSHVIKSIGDHEVVHFAHERQVRIDKKILNVIKVGLRETVSDPTGTAHILDLPNLYVAGKTGTAQTSGQLETHAWFVGYAKGDKRQIAFCVFLEHGGSSQNACLVARDFLLQLQMEQLL